MTWLTLPVRGQVVAVSVDQDRGGIYVRLRPGGATSQSRVLDETARVFLDIDEEGRPVGVEILHLVEKTEQK